MNNILKPDDLNIEKEISSLKKRIDILENTNKDFWEKFKILGPFLSSIIVAIIGVWATYSITTVLEKEKLDLSHLNSMQALLIQLSDPEITKSKAEAIGIILGAFGSHAVGPLVQELGKPGEIHILAAKEGLRAATFNDQEKSIDILLRVINNKQGVFSWKTQQEVIRIIGEFGDHNAIKSLRELKDLLDSEKGKLEYKNMVRSEPQPSPKNIKSLLKLLEKTINKLEN